MFLKTVNLIVRQIVKIKIMKKIAIWTLIIISFSGCENNDNTVELMLQNINFEFIGRNPFNPLSTEDIVPGNYVISNQSEWNALLSKIDTYNSISQAFTTTTIDFNTYQIIAVFDQIRSSVGRTIDVTEIVENQNNITVTVITGGSLGAINVTVQPFHIIKMPISQKPIVFQ